LKTENRSASSLDDVQAILRDIAKINFFVDFSLFAADKVTFQNNRNFFLPLRLQHWRENNINKFETQPFNCVGQQLTYATIFQVKQLL
jgi:hypothetical protein